MSSTSETAAADEVEVLVEVHDGIGRITLNRPAERNPIGVNLAADMIAALDRLEADRDCRAIILTGNGPVFCGGADLKRILSASGDIDMEWQLQLIRGFNRVIQRMRSHDLPIIAAVNGPAVGGGAALAMACDIAIASDTASYYFAFGRIGAAGTDMGCTYLLPRLVGQMRAAHLILTGATVAAEEGRDLGLFANVVAGDELLPTAEAIARQIAEAYPRRAAATTKLGLIRGESMPLEACLDYEAIAQNYNFRGPEHRERLGAFLGRKG